MCGKCWNRCNTPLPDRVHKPDLPKIQSNTLATPKELRDAMAEEIQARAEAKQTKQEKKQRAQHLVKLHHHPTGRLWTRVKSPTQQARQGALELLKQQHKDRLHTQDTSRGQPKQTMSEDDANALRAYLD
jgi:hypothetical protein